MGRWIAGVLRNADSRWNRAGQAQVGPMHRVTVGETGRKRHPKSARVVVRPAIGFAAAVPEIDPELLSRVDLFRDLDKRELKAVASAMRRYSYEAGREVVTKGTEAVGFFVIATGRAKVTVDGDEARILNPGDHFGEVALIGRTKRTATVTAEEPLTCWALSAWDFRPVVEANGTIGWKLLQAMARLLAD
jgi:CRP/FNR family cyclic AMP-dependent transcriptional regulator